MKAFCSASAVLCVLIAATSSLSESESTDGLSVVIDGLEHQDHAWNDLRATFSCTYYFGDSDKGFTLSRRHAMVWARTQDGWERLRRLTTKSGTNGKDWVEEAAHQGSFYMGMDSQGSGSGTIGHSPNSFLQTDESPKRFGLYIVAGQHMTVGEYLKEFRSEMQLLPQEKGCLVVTGPDPFSDEGRITLWFAPELGYRPKEISLSDSRGTYTTFKVNAYTENITNKGKFWFPKSAIWEGYDPTTRTIDSRMQYELDSLAIDQFPNQTEFVLSYPEGALLLNTDTGETIYTSRATEPSDAPLFEDVRLSMAEHDRLQRVKRFDATRKPERLWMILVTTGIVVLLSCLVVFRRSSQQF